MAAHHTLGLVHAAKKNYDRAFDHLSRAAMLNPRNWMAFVSVCLDLRGVTWCRSRSRCSIKKDQHPFRYRFALSHREPNDVHSYMTYDCIRAGPLVAPGQARLAATRIDPNPRP